MNVIKKWRSDRREVDEQKVLAAIGMLRPSRATAYPISRLAHLSPPRTSFVLARLEQTGRVTSEWSEGPKPRRRVYRAVSSAAVAR